MTSRIRALRRAGLVLAAAGATAFSGTAASAAVQHQGAPTVPRRLTPCSASRLTVWMGVPGNGAAGTIYWDLQFSNTSRAACAIRGYPLVRATFGPRHVGRPAVHDTMFKPGTVVLAPGATAHAVLGIAEAGNVCTRPVRADGIRVTPPGAKTWTPLSFGSFQVCRDKVTMHVRVVRPGTGIPGYSQ